MKTIFLLDRIPLLLTFLLLAFTSQAQVVINEFSAANFDADQDNFGEYEDWIELYNTSNTAFDLSGYHLSDRMTNPDKWEFPNGISIPANGYLVVYASGKDNWVGLSVHTSFKITQTRGSEAVVFASPTGTILDFNEIDLPNKKNHSWGKTVNGGDTWGVLTNPTPGGPNVNVFTTYASRANISPDAGYYPDPVTVTLASPEMDITIYYTLDGSTPTAGSTLYTGPFQINATTVVKSIAISSDPQVLPSFVDYHTFFLGADQHSIPVVSISGESSLESLMNGTQNDPQGSFELFDEDHLRVADATGEFNKHGNDSWAYSQRGIDYITRDQFGDDYALKHQIFPEYSERDKFQRLMLKAAANDNYPFEDGSAHIRDAYVHALSQKAGLEMDERTYEPCILYVNGEYWGVYELREKVDDHDFTDYYYDQDREDIDFIKTWGGTWAEYGNANDWDDLVDYILSNDMTDASNYAYVESQLNVLSLIDYMILHSHNVSSDWLNWNTAWWRGRDPDGGAQKWRYALWDEDATFGHYINYTGVPSTGPNADPCNPELLGDPGGQGHIPMLNTLLQNEDFFALYINRYADLNNLYFNCDFMLGFLDELIGRIAPEMPRQISRWGGTVAEWESNVQAMRDFIEERCTVIDNAIVDCYEDQGLSGPYDITINVAPSNSGNVKANTTVGINYPWVTTYFGGIGIDLEAIPATDWEFDHWEVASNVFSPDQFSEAISMSIESGDVITAYFLPLPCAGVNNDPNIQGNLVFCAGEGTTLVAASGYTDYMWSTNSTEQSISITSGGTIGVTVTDGTGCPGYDEVVINALPILETEQSPTICT
ncbi:MAG: CotH kinase family protein, partial [Saprospiraceae bacterium]